MRACERERARVSVHAGAVGARRVCRGLRILIAQRTAGKRGFEPDMPD